MKRAVVLCLILAMLLGLCACGAAGDPEKQELGALKAGYAKADITPSLGIGLAGYFAKGTAEKLAEEYLQMLKSIYE